MESVLDRRNEDDADNDGDGHGDNGRAAAHRAHHDHRLCRQGMRPMSSFFTHSEFVYHKIGWGSRRVCQKFASCESQPACLLAWHTLSMLRPC